VFSASIGLLIFLLFLFFAVQVMLGLYATTTLRATLADAVARAAAGGAPVTPGELEVIAAEAEASLGEMGARPSTVIRLEAVDEDGDGVVDVVVGSAVAVPPRAIPPSIGGMIGFERITAGARMRIEQVR
jgi:hypothetical protein